jgi:type IV pilus assembly protein PilB
METGRERPIGVFDSGVGGISTLKSMIRILPEERFLYYGDMKNAPYGTKTADEVLQCVRGVVEKLQEQDIKALVIACNTATGAAAAALRAELTIPVIAMEPALKPAVERHAGGRILVMATAMTLKEKKFFDLWDQYRDTADIVPVPCDPDQFDGELERYYPEKVDSVADIVAEFNINPEEIEEEGGDEEDLANAAPIIKFVDAVIAQAVHDKASDIHFEPFEKNFRIRYRVDCALYEMPPPPRSLAAPVISRIKIISGLNISERRRPQDGRIQIKVNGRPVDLRVSCLPTSHGESVVLRVLDRSVVNLELDALGIGKDVLEKIRELIHLPNGILLVTGPTGSGKTTTLYSALGEINNPSDKLLTAEDPVEYDIEGIIQCPINDAVGMTFDKALRAFLRQDPDRILVGEIRDFITAQIAVEASLTGHFVFSTLHTNDAASTVTRLVDMGVEPFLIASSLVGVLGQRLIRRVCKNCMTEYVPTDEDLDRLNLERGQVEGKTFVYGKGCPLCNNTGYRGRKALTELLVVNNELREMISNGAPANEIADKACECGMRPLREDGLLAIFNHETTVDEVVRYT